MTLPAGTRLGPYEILAPLGAGGMGEVYRARDAKLGRTVALKVLPADVSNDPRALTRFEAEAKAVAALSHANILAIHDFGCIEGVSFVVMELLDGETLRESLCEGALPVRKGVEYGVQIAEGLAAAHEKGIVHRDVKPENLFVTKEGRIKILDFGLARQIPTSGADTKEQTLVKATEPGVIVGTVGYLSPEQLRGQPADPRSDLFALGCVLYEMLCGKRAFAGETAVDTMSAILHEDPPAIGGPPPLPTIVGRCLEKRPEQRFQSARDLAFALRSLPSVTSTKAEPAPTPRRRAVPAWAFTGLVALVVLAAVFLALQGRMLRPKSSAQLNPRRVLVLPFENRTHETRFDAVGAMAADWINQGLTQTGVMQAIPLGVTLAYAREASWKPAYGGDLKKLGALARELEAGTIVSGAYYLSGGSLQLQAEIFDVRERKLLGGIEPAEASIDKPLEAVHTLRQRVTGILAMRLDPHTAAVASVVNPPPSFAAYQAYIGGQERLGARSAKESEALGHRSTLARAFFLDERYEDAEAAFGRLAVEEPENIEHRVALGILAARKGDRARAEEISRWLQDLDRPYLRGAQTRGRAAIAAWLGEKDRALALLRDALAQGQACPDMHADDLLLPLWNEQTFQELLKPKD